MKTKMKQIKEKTTKGNLLLSVLIAVVAIVFAACSSDVVLNDIAESQTDTPKAIGFTSFSEKITRADTDLEYYHNTFVVYGTKQSTVDTAIQYVFGGKATAPGNQDGVTCTYNATAGVTGNWEYVNPRYWDKQAEYDFIAYAPDNAPLRYFYNAANAQVGDVNNEFVTNADYTLAGTNLQTTASTAEKVKGFTGNGGADLDIMISATNAQNGSTHNDEVNLVFSHILSKLNVTFAKAAALEASTVTVTSVEITGLKEKGSYSQNTYHLASTTSGWTAKTVTPSTYKLAYSGSQILNASTGSAFYFIESLVMPQTIADDQVTLVAKYKIESGTYSENYTYELDLYDIATLQKFFDGYNYTLNFTIAPDVIKFDATVTPWTDQLAVNKTIE
jgi:hypothetical protein